MWGWQRQSSPLRKHPEARHNAARRRQPALSNAASVAHAERLGTRQMAVAMDLSVQATSLHLLSAENTLRPIAAENYEAMLTELSRRYLALTPSATISVPKLRRFVARRLWPRRIRRFLGWLILLAAFAGIGYAVWKIRPLIEF